MQALAVIEHLDVLEDGLSSLRVRLEVDLIAQIGLERRREALGDGVSLQLPARLMLSTSPTAHRANWYSPLGYWLPRLV